MKYISYCMKTMYGLALALSLSIQASAQIAVSHLANEQNIIRIASAKKFLLLPVQDNAPEGQVYIIVNNQAMNRSINVRLAREKVDYYVPLDLSAYQGRSLSVDVQMVPQGSICWEKLQMADTFDMANTEKFRPVYHHTPAYGWMNDPNGMVYKDGVYHLFYQHNPYGCTWGNMHWGHSVSTDLAHWTALPDALAPDAWGSIFSGSCVVDAYNTAGFGTGAIVAFYTSAKPTPLGDCQTQSIAYSLDNGKTFTKYADNPVLTSSERDFRDPKVFWYAPGKHWVMLLAVGQQMEIYNSMNLKDWKRMSVFGSTQGAHGGVWECPDLVQLPIEGSNKKKWVLICNLNPGGPFGGSAAQYFVGHFDGKTFTNEAPTQTKWLDWGKDNYATVTWSNAPQGRAIALGWMSNWQYQAVLPTIQYRGTNTIPRDLSLYERGGETYLQSTPVPELGKLRQSSQSLKAFKVTEQGYEADGLLRDTDGAVEIEMTIKLGSARRIGMRLSNAEGEQVDCYYDIAKKQFVTDRCQSGKTDFSQNFPAVTVAPIFIKDETKLRLLIDRCSIEAFGDGGRFVMTNLVFPSKPYNRLSFYADGGSYTVTSLHAYRLR